MLELFEIRDVLKWRDGLPPLLFSLLVEYVMRKSYKWQKCHIML